MRYVIAIGGLLVVIAILVGIKGAQIGSLVNMGKQAQKMGPPPESVSTATAEKQSWEGTLPAVGSVAAARGVEVSNDAPGVVMKINFESGATVKQGQVLVELDTSVERAQLASAVARRDLAQSVVGRTRALAAKGSISQAQVDADEAQLKGALTEMESINAQIARKTVRAPFAGKLGIRNVNIGQYLNPGTSITVLEAGEGLYVDFSLPQQRLPDVAVGMPIKIAEGDGGAGWDGQISAVDPAVDNATRTIKLRGSVPKDDRLRSGMFVNVAVVLPQHKDLVIVPLTAIVHASYGDSVFIVEDKKPDQGGMDKTPDGKTVRNARQQFVRVGEARGDFVSILDGVTAGQTVVTAGAFKLRNNSPVIENNTLIAKPQISPHPENR